MKRLLPNSYTPNFIIPMNINITAFNNEVYGSNEHLHTVVRRTVGSHCVHQLMVTLDRVHHTSSAYGYRYPPLAAHAVRGYPIFAHKDSSGLSLIALLASGQSFYKAEPTQFRGSPRRAITVSRMANLPHRYSQHHIYSHYH